MDYITKAASETSLYISETIYDMDREKQFDVNISGAATIKLSSGDDEYDGDAKPINLWAQFVGSLLWKDGDLFILS